METRQEECRDRWSIGMRRIAITGATGAIGIALISRCIAQGIEVYALVRSGSKRNDRIPQHELVHLIECDLAELSTLDTSRIQPCDTFYHMGGAATIGDGRNNMQLQLKNVQYTLDAVNLAAKLGCSTFVGAGSQAEYGRYEGNLNGEVPVFPENGYGIAKLCAGQMSRIECEKLGMRQVWVRILSVYGPYDNDNTMVTSTIRKLLHGEKPALTAGEQQWDYLYSEDAAKALVLLGEHENAKGVYCLGSGKAQSLRNYIEMMRDAIDPKAELGFGEIPYGEKQVMYLCADLKRLKEDTGFQPEVAFEKGIEKTIEWMKKRLEDEED